MGKLLNIGQTILNRYVVEDLIGEGGQASIAKAHHKKTKSTVVVKQLAASPGCSNYDEELARFQRAAQIRISHPNVIDPIDYGQEDGEHYMILPFVDGITLENHIFSRGGRLPVDEAIQIAAELASGLGAIHLQGIVDRDLKPSNIIMGSDGHIHIIDLGICHITNQQTITKGSGCLGTIRWMSPEQVMYPGTEDARSDLYSLGAVLYFMLTGSGPIRGNDAPSIMLSICQYVPPPPRQIDPSIPTHVSEACMHLLAKQREARFQNAEEFIQAITGTSQIAAGPSCRSCGSQIEADSRYCPSCGAPIDGQQDQAARCLACGANAGEVPSCPNCGRAFGQSDHRLGFTTGTLTGTTFRIPEGIFQIGRNELSQRDCMISRQHLLVACVDGAVAIEDAGSANKTYVAGQMADHLITLIPNQRIRIAGNTATYSHK